MQITLTLQSPHGYSDFPQQAPCLVAPSSCPHFHSLSQGQGTRNLLGPYRDPLSLFPIRQLVGPEGIFRSGVNVSGLMDIEAFLFQSHHKGHQMTRTQHYSA